MRNGIVVMKDVAVLIDERGDMMRQPDPNVTTALPDRNMSVMSAFYRRS